MLVPHQLWGICALVLVLGLIPTVCWGELSWSLFADGWWASSQALVFFQLRFLSTLMTVSKDCFSVPVFFFFVHLPIIALCCIFPSRFWFTFCPLEVGGGEWDLQTCRKGRCSWPASAQHECASESFYMYILNWSVVALQCCVSSCCVSHTYGLIPSSLFFLLI